MSIEYDKLWKNINRCLTFPIARPVIGHTQSPLSISSGFPDDQYAYRDPDRNQIPEPANYDRLPKTYQNTYNQEQGIPQPRRPDSAPRALREQIDRDRDFFEADDKLDLDKKNTARIWSTDEFTTVGPPQNRGHGYAYNDTMDGIL